MIAIETISKLKTSVVFVAGQLEPGPGVLGLLVGADPVGLGNIIDAPEPRQSPQGLILASIRNQLIVRVSANRLQFEDHSSEEPARSDFANRAVRATEYIGRLSNLTYTAVGITYEIESSPGNEELPSRAMLNRFIRDDVFIGTKYSAIGATTRLWYTGPDRLYDLRIEPRGNQLDGSNYYALLHAHIELEGDVPSEQWLSGSMQEEYNGFKKVLTEILNPEGRP